MKYITDTLDFSLYKRSIVTLGKFDGLHRGHQKLLQRLLSLKKPGFDTVIFTFDVSPVMRLKNPDFNVILTNEERRRLAERTGIDCLIECPFVPEIMNMSGEDFICEVLVRQLKVSHVIVGPDFRFGYKRGGNTELLERLGGQYGFQVEVMQKVKDGDREISSTYIRDELQCGRIEKANQLLGYPFFIDGEVLHGRHLGHTIGVPTINQRPGAHKLLPPYGVYASTTEIEGETWFSVTNIGEKPTVGKDAVGIETHLFDCDRKLYHKNATVKLYQFIRPEYRFDSLSQLKHQIEVDQNACRNYFSQVFTSGK